MRPALAWSHDLEPAVLTMLAVIFDNNDTGARENAPKSLRYAYYVRMIRKVKSLRRRSSKYLDQISSRREFHHVGMWFTQQFNMMNECGTKWVANMLYPPVGFFV
jgi:hypothetical protein